MNGSRDILVVEDDSGIRQTIVECLEFEGYTVRQAANGVEAIEDIRRRGLPGLVLLDIVMPGMNGQQLLEKLKQDPATAAVPVVVMTAAMTPLAGPVPGAEGLLSKPFELSQMLDEVARYCGPATAATPAPP